MIERKACKNAGDYDDCWKCLANPEFVHLGVGSPNACSKYAFVPISPPEPPEAESPKCLTCGAEYDDWVDQFNCNDPFQDSLRYKGGME